MTANSDITDRAREIAAFLGIPEAAAIDRLSKGFAFQHQRVNDDFRRVNPQTDDELLNWYRTTEEYIWELSAYHADPGFNYDGMCGGIVERVKADGCSRVLCLGDGIGDLTLAFARLGYATGPGSVPTVVYHDLTGSKTHDFAKARIMAATGEFIASASHSFEPKLTPNLYEAIISLDFLEHVTDVPAWCREIYRALRPGGLFCAQNAFDCGSGPNGAIPCHLAINDKYAHAAPHTAGRALWDHLLIEEIGFQQEGSNWYRKPA